jgi:hypothetical protein
MLDRDPFDIETAEPSTLLQFCAILLFVGVGIALLIIAATPVPQ